MKKMRWEYLLITNSELVKVLDTSTEESIAQTLTEKMNGWGSEGWELAHVEQNGGMIFKRPVQ